VEPPGAPPALATSCRFADPDSYEPEEVAISQLFTTGMTENPCGKAAAHDLMAPDGSE
jgi:hypothetical protein